MLTYTLGPYGFHGMWGTPEFDQTQVAGEVRPGVDGTSFYDIGAWGEPVEIQTIRFMDTYANAIEGTKAYAAAASLDPLELTIGSVPVTGGKYKVLKVKFSAKRCVRAVIAGDATVYTAEIRASWTVVPVAD